MRQLWGPWTRTTMCKLWLFTVSLFELTVVVASNDCSFRPCEIQNNAPESDTEVFQMASLNCGFKKNLCCYTQGCADFSMGNWTTKDGYSLVLQTSTSCGVEVYSTLESPWVKMTTPSCVEFTYHRGTPYQLQVFLAFPNGTQPSLKYDSQDVSEDQNHRERFDVECLTGKIQFRAKGGGSRVSIAPPKIYYVRVLDGRCETDASRVEDPEVSDPTSCELATTTPPTTEHTTSGATTHLSFSSMEASTSSQPPATGGSSTFSSSSQQSSTGTGVVQSSSQQAPTSTGVVQSSSQQSSTGESMEQSGGSGNDVAVIAGASVAAIVAVVAFVIIVLLYRRKFRPRKPDGRKSSVEGMSTSARDGDYTDIDAVGSLTQATAGNADVNPDDPYELAKDGAPGKTRNSHTDPFTNGASHNNHHQLNGTREDDYSCIDHTQPTAAGVHGKNTAQAKPDPRDVYSVVNKPGKKTPTPGYSLAKIVGDKPVLSNPNDEYSVVNKPGKKPDVAPKPGHSDSEYNTISHKENNATGDKAARGATSDPYNRIGAVTSLGTKGQNKESKIAEKGSLVDEYNTLDFADTRQNESKKEKSGAPRAAYDHVHNNPDDTYNRTRIGKRNVVIGSDYDHVKP